MLEWQYMGPDVALGCGRSAFQAACGCGLRNVEDLIAARERRARKGTSPLPPLRRGRKKRGLRIAECGRFICRKRTQRAQRHIPPCPPSKGEKEMRRRKGTSPLPPFKGGERNAEKKRHIPPAPLRRGRNGGFARRRRSASIAQGNALGKGNPPFVEPCRGDLVGAAARVLGQLGRPLQILWLKSRLFRGLRPRSLPHWCRSRRGRRHGCSVPPSDFGP
jgi:hypothetical protein